MSETGLLILGFVATTLTAVAAVPQVIKTIKTKDTSSVSLLMFLALTIGYACWLVYGIFIDSLPMVIGNAVGISFQTVVIVYKCINIAKGKEPFMNRKKKAAEERPIE